MSAPNSTTSAIIDGEVILTVIESSPKSKDLGIFASQYGGFMYGDLPADEWEYGFSHIRLEIDMQFDDNNNISLGKSWVQNVVSDLESEFNIDFLQFNNYTHSGDLWWTSEYRAYVNDQSMIWNNILNDLPCGETLISQKEKFNSSENKAFRIFASWDEFDPSPGPEDSELRWEYNVDLDLYNENLIDLKYNDTTKVTFQQLLNYTGDFEMPTWVNASDLDIYLYKGAEITNIYPSPPDDGQERAHIERQMERDGEMLGTLPSSAYFNFTDSKQSEPILQCFLTSNSTVVDQNGDIRVTRTIKNVGNETAYNIDITQPIYELVSVGNFDLISGDFDTSISSLNPGQSNSSSIILRCNHGINREREYQFNVAYDAISNPSLADHWSGPEFGGDRFTHSSNRIAIYQNDINPDPWMVVSYEISDLEPSVGDNITVTTTIKNIGENNTENIRWNFNSFPNYGSSCNLGINLTAESGVIEHLNAGQTKQISVEYKIDAYNRYFGGTCDLIFDEVDGTSDIVMDSYNINYNDAGTGRILVFPKLGQVFGPILDFNFEMITPSNETGTIISVEFEITNIGTSPAYNVYPTASYRDGDETFYIEFFSGIIPLAPGIGILQPNESVHFNSRFKLLHNVSLESLSITPYATYTIHKDGYTDGIWNCFATPNQYIEEGQSDTSKSKMNPTTIWMIIAISAIGVIGIESFVLYKKIKVL